MDVKANLEAGGDAALVARNPYAPPHSHVSDVAPRGAAVSDNLAFFPVSVTKLLMLSFCSLGWYELYWFYKNWQFVRRRTDEDISPLLCTIFGIFTCYSLFCRIRDHDAELSSAGLEAGSLAAAFIVFALAWELHRIFPSLSGAFLLIAYVRYAVLWRVQRAINIINRHDAPGHDPNSSFSPWNWALIAVGGVLHALVWVAVLDHALG